MRIDTRQLDSPLSSNVHETKERYQPAGPMSSSKPSKSDHVRNSLTKTRPLRYSMTSRRLSALQQMMGLDRQNG